MAFSSTSSTRRSVWTCAQQRGDEKAAARKRAADEMVRRDLAKLKQNQKQVQKETETDTEEMKPMLSVRSAVETLLLVDFFLVVSLLAWLVVALVPHFAAQNDVLLDPWLALWKPFIQPVLGVLMLGTIVQGTISYVSKNQ